MKNLKEQLKKSKPHELGTMIGLVLGEYPTVTQSLELSNKVSEIFGIDCTIEDVLRYQENQQPREDFELESRRHEFGHHY